MIILDDLPAGIDEPEAVMSIAEGVRAAVPSADVLLFAMGLLDVPALEDLKPLLIPDEHINCEHDAGAIRPLEGDQICQEINRRERT